MNYNSETIFELYWEGPFDANKFFNDTGIEELKEPESKALYQIYGDHPVYGPNSLLYIGESEEQGDIITRIKQHHWLKNQAGECSIYVASCYERLSIDSPVAKDHKYFKGSTSELTIKNIESLLIYAHQPSKNSQCIKSLAIPPSHFRIFNYWKRKSLDRELSTRFYDHNEFSGMTSTTNK